MNKYHEKYGYKNTTMGYKKLNKYIVRKTEYRGVMKQQGDTSTT